MKTEDPDLCDEIQDLGETIKDGINALIHRKEPAKEPEPRVQSIAAEVTERDAQGFIKKVRYTFTY